MSASTATASTASRAASDHAPLFSVFMQVSVALALVLFVRDLLTLAPLDHALLTAAGTGFVVYFALVGGYFVVRHILDASAAAPAPASDDASPDTATPPDADASDPVPAVSAE